MIKNKFFILYFFIPIVSYSQNWVPLDKGFNSFVRCVYHDSLSGLIYAGGDFGKAADSTVMGIAFWDGNEWQSLGLGMDAQHSSGFPNHVQSILRYGNDIYACGGFNQAGTIYTDSIAKWNGLQWDSLSSRFNSTPFRFRIIDNELYICGTFDTVGNIVCNGLIKWNGSQFSNVGNLPRFDTTEFGEVNTITDVIKFQDKIYIAGNFHGVDGLSSIAYLDSGTWKPLHNGVVGTFAYVTCMAEFNGELYVSGLFTKQEGNTGDHIQKWNGVSWSEPGNGLFSNGVFSQVNALIVLKNHLIAVGSFELAGGVPAERIAMYDGQIWCGLGSHFNNTLLSIEVIDSTFIICGGFTTIDGDTMNYISKWTGGSIVDTCSSLIGINPLDQEEYIFFPNPCMQYLTIKVPDNPTKAHVILVKNLLGITVASITLLTDQEKYTFNSVTWPSGIYFVEVQTDQGRAVKKIIKE